MGQWTSCCKDCTPSVRLQKKFATTLAACPDHWIFQVITEDGHNGRLITPRKTGTWFICCYQEDEIGMTRLQFTLSFNDSKKHFKSKYRREFGNSYGTPICCQNC